MGDLLPCVLTDTARTHETDGQTDRQTDRERD